MVSAAGRGVALAVERYEDDRCSTGGAGWLSSGLDEREKAMSKLIDIERLFNGRRFDREVTVLCVRCYLRYKLSL